MYYVWDLRLSSKEHTDNSFGFVELLEQFIKGSPSENHNIKEAFCTQTQRTLILTKIIF